MSVNDIFLMTDSNVGCKVVKFLELGKSYPKEIAEKTNLDPRAVTFCLRYLEREGLLTQKLEKTTNPFKPYVRNFNLTERANEALKKINEIESF